MNALVPFLPDGTTYKQFIDAENNVGKMYSGKVSPTIADDIKRSSVWAVLGSLNSSLSYISYYDSRNGNSHWVP
jgi:SecD/SecF fusion protein